MKMEDRRPRAARFERGDLEARLAQLREQAPTLGSSRRLRVYAVFGAVLLALTVAALYFAMQVFKAAAEHREEAALIEVDPAPALVESESAKALQRLEAEQAAEEAALREQLEALKQVDLLDALPEE
jgi:hypothetical protein